MHQPQLKLSDSTDEQENLHHVKAFCTIEVENAIKSLGPPVFSNEDDLPLFRLVQPVKEEFIVMEAVGVAEIQDLAQDLIRIMIHCDHFTHRR